MLRVPIALGSALLLSVAFSRGAEPAANAVAPRGEKFEHVRPEGGDELHLALRADLHDGRLDEFSLLEAALVAGGTRSRAELESYTSDIHQVCEAIAAEGKSLDDLPTKLGMLHQTMHDRFLTGPYDARVADLRGTLQDGQYNCVTATILFQAISEQLGFPVVAIAAPEHVLCMLPGTRPVYIETTCRDWLPVTLEECPAALRTLIQQSRKLNSTQVLSKVYYNLGVARLAEGDFAGAAELLGWAVKLDREDIAARENLLATYNNWSLSRSDHGAFDEAVELLVRGLEMDRRYAPLLANDAYIHQRWIRDLCANGNFDQASAILDRAYRRRPEVELFDSGRLALLEVWAEFHFLRGEFAMGWEALDRCEESSGSEPYSPRRIAIVVEAYEKLLGRQQDVLARQLLLEAESRWPGCRDLLQSKSHLLQSRL